MKDLELLEQVDWRLSAECRRLTAAQVDRYFFGNRTSDLNEGRALCAICPVRDQCLELADQVETGVEGTRRHMAGIWGGLYSSERRARREKP